MDMVESRFAFAMHGAQGTLQDPPGDCFATACLAYDHGGVPRVLGFVKLNDFGHCEGSDLQAVLLKLCFYSFS